MAEEQEQGQQSEAKNIIIIKKKKVMGHGHHGGAWKIAYADFVTAMMAFFLLMWLLNSTSEEQKRGIADFFAPISVFESEARTGGSLGSKSVSVQGAFDGRGKPTENVLPKAGTAGPEENMSETEGELETNDDGSKSDIQQLIEKIIASENQQETLIDIDKNPDKRAFQNNEGETDTPPEEETEETINQDEKFKEDGGISEIIEKEGPLTEEKIIEEYKKLEDEKFKEAEGELIESLQQNGLADLKDNLIIEQTKDGLLIQIVDAEKRPMFASGSAELQPYTKELLKHIADIIIDLGKNVSIKGHTDAQPFSGRKRYSNWELSADRANSSRRTLEEYDVPLYLFERVIGLADKDPLIKEDPYAPQNRRVSLTVLREDEISKILGEMAKEIPAYDPEANKQEKVDENEVIEQSIDKILSEEESLSLEEKIPAEKSVPPSEQNKASPQAEEPSIQREVISSDQRKSKTITETLDEILQQIFNDDALSIEEIPAESSQTPEGVKP